MDVYSAVQGYQPTSAFLLEASTDVPGLLVGRRSDLARERSPERLHLDRRRFGCCPLLQKEEQLRVLDFQGNGITRLENMHGTPNLLFLDLYDNKLRRIENLESVAQLQVLMLGKNQVSCIENLDRLTSLDVLDLHNNRLVCASGLQNLLSLRVLNLAGNMLHEVKSLQGLASLTELNVRRNAISSMAGLERCDKLRRLFASHNCIGRLDGIEPLACHPSLAELALDGNPLCGISDYRPKVLALCRLERLDDEGVRRDELAVKETQHGHESLTSLAPFSPSLRVPCPSTPLPQAPLPQSQQQQQQQQRQQRHQQCQQRQQLLNPFQHRASHSGLHNLHSKSQPSHYSEQQLCSDGQELNPSDAHSLIQEQKPHTQQRHPRQPRQQSQQSQLPLQPQPQLLRQRTSSREAPAKPQIGNVRTNFFATEPVPQVNASGLCAKPTLHGSAGLRSTNCRPELHAGTESLETAEKALDFQLVDVKDSSSLEGPFVQVALDSSALSSKQKIRALSDHFEVIIADAVREAWNDLLALEAALPPGLSGRRGSEASGIGPAQHSSFHFDPVI